MRALDTACTIAKYQPNRIEVIYGLRELRDAKTHICMTGKELKVRFPIAEFSEEIFLNETGWVFTGDENREICKNRAGKAFEYIKSITNEESKILIVAHIGFITGFLCSLLSLDSNTYRFGQENTAINRILIKDNIMKIVCLNDGTHLYSRDNS